jgi:glycosyltransferase involved in cell wall biosynthesis
MIRIAALTSGKFDPSSRFRVRQHIKQLGERGINVHEYIPFINKYTPLPLCPAKFRSSTYALPLSFIWNGIKLAARIPGVSGSRRKDITWLLRDLLPGCRTFEAFLRRPLVFDVDDAVWLHRPFGKEAVISVAKRADIIIAGNNYIARWFEPYSQRIHVVPTAIDTERFKPKDPLLNLENERFTIGWIGSSSNLKYLVSIEHCMKRFMVEHPDSEIVVISDKSPNLKNLPADRFRYIPWSEDIEVAALMGMDVGIMPLPENEWTKGKCSFKMLQYMACEIPVIVSPVGMNTELLAQGKLGLAAVTDSDWHDGLSFFYKNRNLAKDYGRAGRVVAEKYYSKKRILGQLADIFKGFI